ncbi:MAG: DUF1667 domain-containing protein [Oligoflexia bacterium]|nr:DUF1667 domain-containing protein [Oligoflexia bacterium]MBF0366562.1 DUF1667 domain-containing protein [Oligoflexia bacterium]
MNFICIVCPKSCPIDVLLDEENKIKSISGANCKNGLRYATQELSFPSRVFTSIVKLTGGQIAMCPVKSDQAVPRELILKMSRSLCQLSIAAPVKIGDIVVENILGTKANIVVTRNIDKCKQQTKTAKIPR